MDVGTEMYLQFLQGDESMLEKLVAAYSDGLVAFAYCIVSDSAVAEDVVEDAFATLIVRRRHFSPKAKFKTYLYKIVRNKCLDYLRFHKKFVPLCDVENVLATNCTEESLEQSEMRQTVLNCLSQLPVQYRDVLQLSYLEGFSVDEICVVLRKNPKQVYNLLSRAKHSLKETLSKEGAIE